MTFQNHNARCNSEFYRKLLRQAVPMAIQQLLMSSLYIIDTIIVSSLGDSYIAAIGQSTQVSLLMWCSFFAISSGGSIFAAQYWGKNEDLRGVRRAFSASMILGGFIALLFFVIVIFFNRQAMNILSRDPKVIAIGRSYMQIVGYAYISQVFSAMLSCVLKATNRTRIPMIASLTSVLTNIVLDIFLVYGLWIFPRMEEKGAALATVFASIVEISVMTILSRVSRAPITLRKKDFVRLDKTFLRHFMKIVLPILSKDQLWALGMLLYSITFSYMGTTALAAYNVYTSLGEFMNILFISIGSAGGILIGQLLGASEIEKAKDYAWRLLRLAVISGFFLCPILILGRSVLLLPFPSLSSEAVMFVRHALLMTSLIIWAKGINFINMNGILRCGGDTIAAAVIDIGARWIIGVPLTMMAGMLLKLPFEQVFAITCLEEVIKTIISTQRVRKYRWAKKLV